MELYIFDQNLDRIGIVDIYENLEFDHRYDAHSLLFITLDATPINSELFLRTDGFRILTKANDISNGFIVNSARYEDEDGSRITLSCASLSYLLSWRVIEGQQSLSGNVEEVMRQYVTNNAISPANANRAFPNLVLGNVFGISHTTEELYSYKPLDEALWEICKKFEISYRIVIDHSNKSLIFEVFEGLDRSTNQDVNSKVIFSKEFDNLIYQSYVDDNSNYRNMIYVLSGGDEANKTTTKVQDDITGYSRREVFAEAGDITRTYVNRNNQTITIPLDEFTRQLTERGRNTLAEYKRVQTFESDVDLYSQFVFRKHYNLGDKLTTRNDDVGIVTHSRVVRVIETYKREGYSLQLEFGTSIPTLVDKIKREVKR